MSLPNADKALFLCTLPPNYRERFAATWSNGFALPHQRPPEFAQGGGPWTTWLILGGRGAGKTRAGAEWVRAQAARSEARASR